MLDTILLLPAPQQLRLTGGTFPLTDRKLILLKSKIPRDLRFSAMRFQKVLHDRLGLTWQVVASQAVPKLLIGLAVELDPGFVDQAQGYELSISADGIKIIAQDAAGVFYAICTLVQIVEQAGPNLPCLEILDWPDFPARGVMLDISRDKVPTMETLFALVDKLAGWKVNQLQLYTEHTFAYHGHPEVWANASPLTGEEILDLDEFCCQRHIELVPNQNSFGHLHRWLSHPAYTPLAEVVDGFEAPWGHLEGSFSLCPVHPGSLAFLRSLYDELLPHFSSRLVNVGCDETFDLGQGRSKDRCAEYGTGRVYMDFLMQIYQEVKSRGFTMQFWADIIHTYPQIIPELPKDIIALEWGYEADYPFADHCAKFAQAGIPFYVCPGTSSWSSLAGRTQNALGNLINAAENGLKFGAIGYLITDWGDNGHWQPLPVSYLGFAAGAAYAWAVDANREMDVQQAVSIHGFGDPSGAMGRVASKLGDVYQSVGVIWPNSSILSGILQTSLEKAGSYKGISVEGFHRALNSIDQAMLPISGIIMSLPDREIILDEYQLVARLLRHACRRGILSLAPDGPGNDELRHCLDQDMRGIIENFRRIWLKRNRPGGLEDSLARLQKAQRDYLKFISMD
jgi:hexosaminidase